MNIPDTDLPPLPEPTLHCHELLDHDNKQNGIWLGCKEKHVVEQAHTPGETGEEILTLYTADQLREAQRQAYAKGIADFLKANEGKAVAEMHPDHLKPAPDGEHWCREVLLYSGGSPHDQHGTQKRAKLFLTPQPQEVEAAVMADAERWRAFRAAWHEIDGSCDTLMGGLAVADSHADIDAAIDAIRARTTSPETRE